MPKKIIYAQKEHDQLFLEYMKGKYPDYKELQKKFRYMTDEEQNALFLEICNKYGENGWIVFPHPYVTKGGRIFFMMYKEVYAKKR